VCKRKSWYGKQTTFLIFQKTLHNNYVYTFFNYNLINFAVITYFHVLLYHLLHTGYLILCLYFYKYFKYNLFIVIILRFPYTIGKNNDERL